MTEFIARLKQRKLVQWAVAYVAFAFAVLQGIDIVAQRFDWPATVERLLIIAICVGFFVTLLLAWYPIRHDPRFQALLKKYAKDEPPPSAASAGASQ